MLLSVPQDPLCLGTMKPGPLRRPRLAKPVLDVMDVERPNSVAAEHNGKLTGKRAHHGTGVYFNSKELGASVSRRQANSTLPSSSPRLMDHVDYPTDDPWDSSNPLPPKQELEATPMPDIAFSNSTLTPENDVTSLYKAMGDWKPFVNRVAKFIEQERFPFEYVDIWIADDDASETNRQGSSSRVLKHVGHATNSSTEIASIFTMYHMNQFGDNSEKYVFPPGIGLPGRVLARGEPIWDDKLSNAATYSDFPRTALARKHGVRKGLGIPLALPDMSSCTTRQAIVVMYTTQEGVATGDHGRLIHMMCQRFQRNQTSLISSSLTISCALESNSRTKSQQPKLLVDDHHDDNDDNLTYQAILPTDNEVEMARILREHAEIQQGSAESLQTVYTLHALLVRAPCRRSLPENVRVDSLAEQFQAFRSESEGQDDNDGLLADMIVSTWEDLCWDDMCSTLGGSSSSSSSSSSRKSNNETIEIEEIDMEVDDDIDM